MNARGRVMLAAAAGLACGIGSACTRPSAATDAGTDLPTVAVAKATRSDMAQTLTISAEFRPYQEIDIHAKVAGYVKSIAVDVGDRVQAGQLLAVLEIPELQDELEQSEATVKRADEEIKRSQADLERAEAAHEVAHLSATRLAAVMKERPNLVAQQDIDEASGRDRVAEAQMATGRAALAAAREQLEMAKANRNKNGTLLAYSRITAPFSGVITHRYADTGAMIQAGTSSQTQAMPIVKLSQNDTLRLLLPIPESVVPRVRVGQSVDVTVGSTDLKFVGTVARFSDRLDEQTRTMHTEVDVKNPDLKLIPGMYATTGLKVEERKGVLTVPVQAVDRVGTKTTVLVVNREGKVESRPIELGLETPELFEVKSGLDEGDLVVVSNRNQLKAGSTVSPKLQSARATLDQ
jgi:RND family efflux transporter MFP subunit